MDAYQEQYNKLKEQYPDATLLFRCGEFYESYFADAKKVSEILGITLTRRKGDSMDRLSLPCPRRLSAETRPCRFAYRNL